MFIAPYAVLVKLGGKSILRDGYTTDNGNLIIDVHNLSIMEPAKLEAQLNKETRSTGSRLES